MSSWPSRGYFRVTVGSLLTMLLALVAWAPMDGQPVVRSTSGETAQERRADLDALLKRYVERAPAFTPHARAHARAMIAAAKKNASRFSDTGFFLEIARVIALADNGHDSIDPGDSSLLPPLTLPVRLVWMGKDLVVTRARPPYSELVGARVVRIGGLTPQELFRRYRVYQGGNEAYRRVNLMWLVHNPAVLAAIGAASNSNRIPLTVELASGKQVHRALAAIPAAEDPHLAYPAGLWSTESSPSEKQAGWTGLGVAAPLYLQEPDRYFRLVSLPKLDSLYVQFRVNLSEGDQAIEPFVEQVSRPVAAGPRNLVLDLRFDTGGDIGTTVQLMRQIGHQVRGRIFVITGPYTFSAGIASAAAVLQAGGRKVTIVGEGVGDRTYWWSERQPLCLPHSKVCAPLQLGYWDLVHGCKGQSRCYGDQFHIRVRSLTPDIAVSPSAAKWRSGEDPAMEAIEEAIARPAERRSHRKG